MSQMLSVPLNRIRSPKLKRQTPVEDEIDGQQQNPPSKPIVPDFESNSSRSLSPYCRVLMDPESSSSYLDVPETTNNSRRSSNNSGVRFTPNDSSDLCSILDMSCESENLEKAIISNDKYTVRRIIDIHQNKFNLLKDHLSVAQTQAGFPIHPLPPTQPPIHPNTSGGSPSITSNTDLLEAVSKQALASNDTDEPQSLSSPEPTNSMFDASSSVLTYTTGPLAAALINYHHQTYPNNYLTSNQSSLNVGSSTNERTEIEHDSMFTAPTSFAKDTTYPTSDSPNDAPPIFRNVLHVAIIYDARDVMRICLKYGIDPNASGIHPNIPLNSQISPSNTYNQINTRLSPDLPRASPCRNGTLDYTGYYTTERLFTLPPLFLAAQRNNHYACTLLLKYGANVNVRDEQYCSPLHLAARLQHNVCDILVSHHASITITNKYGDTPLSLWTTVKHLQTSFVEREFRKLCQKHSSSTKRYRFLSRDTEQYQTTTSLINFNNNNSMNNNNFVPGNGLKNLKRVFRYSGSDSYDSKSFKKSFSSQSSMGKSKRIVSSNVQSSIQGTSVVRSESRQLSEEHDDVEISHTGRSSNVKRKTGTSSLAANILHAHKSSRQQQHSATTAAHASAETNVLNDRLNKRFSELSRLATNTECIDQLMDLLRMQNSMDEILSLISQTTSPQVHAKIAELLHTLLNTSYQEFLRNHDKRDYIENFQNHTKKLLDISLELLSSDIVHMQYVALITINRLYDVYVYHNLINPGRYNPCYIPLSRRQCNSKLNLNINKSNDLGIKTKNDRSRKSSTITNILRRISRENENKHSLTNLKSSSSSNTTQQLSGSNSGIANTINDCPRQTSKRWIPPNSNDNLPESSSTSTLIHSIKDSSSDITNNQISKSNLLNSDNFSIISNENSNTIYTYEPFSLLYQIEPIHLLRLMRTRLDAHRKEFNNRSKCVPSTRSPLCTHHCVVILAARLLTILCQDHTFQLRFIGTKENLAITIDMLNINNDPHLICLILQTLGVVALNPDCHEILTQADIPDTVLHLILPADEMFYTNQTTKFARYVKHLGARILVYMGLLTKVSNKVNLFDILDVEPEPLDCDKPQSFENNFVHHMAFGETIVGTLWTSFAGICIEKLLDELLKNGINQKKSSSKESQDASQPPTSPTSSSAIINSSDNLLYNLSYLSSVIHPVIILRLLEHRIFTPLFKKKSILINPPISSLNNNNNNNVTPNLGISVLATIPTIPRPDVLIQPRYSLSKQNRKTPSTSISGITTTTTNSQSITNNDLLSNSYNSTDFSVLFQPTTINNTNQTTRKWFWRNSDKTIQSNISNDRNPLLKAIVENDLINSTDSVSATPTTNVAGVGEIKLLEKELLNLPTFQLSDSQNPLLPSPTGLNDDFPAQFRSSTPTINVIINRQYSNNENQLQKSKINDTHDYSSSMAENLNRSGNQTTTLNIPFVAVRTPSDDSNNSSSFNSIVSKQILSTNSRLFVGKRMKNFFRTSKTIDNISSILNNGNHLLANISKCNRNIFKLKSLSDLSNSQPIVNENSHCNSTFTNHNERTSLIESQIDSKPHNTKSIRFNRQELHLPLDNDCLPRSRSCTDGIIPSNNPENDSTNPITSNLQPNNSDTNSVRSADSIASSLSTQQQLNIQQTNENTKNEINKSQESIFSLSSSVKKPRSIKSLIMAAANKDKTTKQDNDVLVLIASWVLRSPEDFQDYLVQKELRSFFTLLESLRSSFRTWTNQIKEILALQDDETPLGTEIDDVTTEDIYREYIKMQRDIVSGVLICSKDEAATLAAVQLRLEAWPEENLDLAEEDELHRLSMALNDQTSPTNPMISTPWRNRHRHDIVKFHLSNISCCKRVDSNTHKSKKPCLPPNFRHSNEIFKLIKDKQRKLFHINDYDNPTRLKECYVRLCRNLPGYNAEIYVVKEIHGKRSKGKGNRLLCIRSDKIYLLDMKTRIIYKEQRIADLEHWITSGHHLSAGINELVLEFRGKTKWRLQLNTTADLRAITVYLWKIVNVEGFALLDKHIPLSTSMRRYSHTCRNINNLPTTSLTNNRNKNPYQTISDMYKNSSNQQRNSATITTTDHIQNLTGSMPKTRTTALSGLLINSSYLHPTDNTQPFCFSSDLEELKYLFNFPEEVAIRLTEIEHEIFLSVPPLQYLRHLTLDMSFLPTQDTSIQGKSIRILVQRFQAVGSFIQQLIISQTNFQERKAIVASILRCAITCWYMGNFNSAMQILAGLKIEAFRPLWLTISDEIPGFKFLIDAFNSNEKTPQYCDAVSRALDIPTCKVVPFFGTFLKDLRTILSNVPSIVVLCNRNTQKPIETVADFQNQEHFLTRIGVGGLINTRKIELVHMVLKDIAMFHDRHRRQPVFKCCNDLNRVKSPIHPLIPEMKEKHSATVCDPIIENSFDKIPKSRYNRHQSFPCTSVITTDEVDQRRLTNIAIQVISDNETKNSLFPYRSMFDIDEPETYYCLNVSFYQPICQPKHDHHVSMLSMHHIIDFNNLQMLRNGTTLILYDEDTMHTCLVTVRLELDNCTLTWTKPSWDTNRSIENINTNNQVLIEAAHYSILMKRYILRDVAFVDMDEGFLQLKYVKHIRNGILHCDLLPIIKRYKLNDITNPENCFTIVYGSSISENKTLCFISPKYCSQIWYLSIDKLITQYHKHRLCSDRRIVWLKNQYLSLYHENEHFQGPTPMTAILIFGGRQWNTNSLFSYERDHSSSKKSGSVRKSWSNIGLRRRNKFEQDRKASFPMESEAVTGSKWQQHHSTLVLRNKTTNFASPIGKTSRSLIQHQTSLKQRPGLVNNRSNNILLNSLNNKRLGNKFLSTNHSTQMQDSSSSSSPWNIDENYMDFSEFVELFKSFYFHCRRDLKDLFDKFATEINIEQDYTIKEQYKNDSVDISRHLTGLITRNILDGVTDINLRRIYDMIAISSIPCYAISTHTRGNYLITKEQFQDFLIEHQKENKSSYEVEQIIFRHEPNRQNRFNKVLSFEGFSRYLLDKENYAFINEHTKANEQDMDYPLSYYFVASSHNTYLTGHQLRGESSVEMYREVLLSGCRCIELDCWDGDDGYPVIYHGRTFVSKISFKLVVEVINESAFVTSPYPVILSIENRCTLIQQARMAQTFVKVFGDKLITKYMFDTDFNEDPSLPSPNQLKYKILIKNKKINKMHSATQLNKQKLQLSVNYRNSVYSSPDDNEEDDDSDDDELIDDYNYDPYARRESQRSNSMTDSPIYQLKKNITSGGVDQDGDDDIRSYRPRRYSIMNNEPARQRLKSSSSIDANHILKTNKPVTVITKIPTILVAKELSDIVIYTQAIKFRGLACSSISTYFIGGKSVRKTPKRNIQQLVAQPSTTSTESSRSIDQAPPCHQIVSLIENKVKKLCKNQAVDMIAHTETQLVRCYPSGFRVDSSNFNPLHLWIYGIQLAATNYQTLDAGQIVNLAMFEQNGNCGYVLKPNIFWDKEHPQYGRFNPSLIEREGSCFELTITIISGQYLTQNISSTTSVYIEVELLGIPMDSISRKTKPSVKNSLNPIWQETFIFQLFFSELAFIRFHVYDAGSNHLMSQRVMPLKCLRPGYRHVRLRDITNVPLELATLFIYSKITEIILIRSPEPDLLPPNTPHLFRNRILRRTADPSDATSTSRESIRPKHKTFEVKVYGKEGRDEEFRPFAVTQYTTVEELIEMIVKSNDFLQVGGTSNDIILTESSKTWKKKASSSKNTDNPARILEKHERILEVIDRVGRETVILCKKKALTSQHPSLSTLIDKNTSNSDRTFLVTIYNISSIQKPTTFRTLINSTAIHVITQLMRKIHMSGMPNDYGLVEETDLNGTNRRIPIKRRLLMDDEKVYGIQRLWTSTNSKFVLVKKSEYSETNNNKVLTDKFLFRSLTRQKSIDRDSREDIHVDHQLKSRINTTLNGNFMNNRTTLTPPIPKNNQPKRSLKSFFTTNRS